MAGMHALHKILANCAGGEKPYLTARLATERARA